MIVTCVSLSRVIGVGQNIKCGRALGAAPGKTPRRRRIAHAGVILAQDGSWRFFDRGGDGGDAGRVLPDRTVGDRGRLARQGFFSLRRAAQRNSRWRWRLSMRFARTRHDGRSRVLGFYSYSVMSVGIARALGCRGQANLWALDTFRHVQSSKNSSARGCKKKCQWKTRFVLLDRSRDISREERITGQSMNEGVETQATN